ncbi:DUF202 domain-containing protein [uncultured Microbacterium sp.]|uniref:DUF202 domain-containing protein n=1 Tax=uncultured Microbacterium sp. TaxID=191216 RepID=UPI00260D7371|nr:DUF202 domain-containing protein [uncultured Microbacterium sp.]
MTSIFDPGLQPERTELAWRRTALAIGVGSLVSLRLLPAVLGSAWWALLGVAGVAFASAIWVMGSRRIRATNSVLLRREHPAVLAGAGPLIALAVFSAAAGVFALGLVLSAVVQAL